jgi:hypothetical protein
VGSTIAPLNVIRPPDAYIDPLAAATRGMHSIPTTAALINNELIDHFIAHLAVPRSYYGVPKCNRRHASKSLERKSARAPARTKNANHVTLFRCECRFWRGGHHGDVKLPGGLSARNDWPEAARLMSLGAGSA